MNMRATHERHRIACDPDILRLGSSEQARHPGESWGPGFEQFGKFSTDWMPAPAYNMPGQAPVGMMTEGLNQGIPSRRPRRVVFVGEDGGVQNG